MNQASHDYAVYLVIAVGWWAAGFGILWGFMNYHRR